MATRRTSRVPTDTDWNTTLLDPTRWRLTGNRVVLSTDDAGRHWRTVALPDSVRAPQHPDDDLEFLPANPAWAIPFSSNGGPIQWTTGGNVWRPVTIRLGRARTHDDNVTCGESPDSGRTVVGIPAIRLGPRPRPLGRACISCSGRPRVTRYESGLPRAVRAF
jgi:hypothetical protein